MREEAPRLFTGTTRDCREAPTKHPGVGVVHACKYPCHAGRCGAKVAKDSPSYLTHADHGHLYLNMIDPEHPLFKIEMFQTFLKWTANEWSGGRSVLIHCNLGMSRSRGLAMLLLARLGILGHDENFKVAVDTFEELTGAPWIRGNGINTFLRQNWDGLMHSSVRPDPTESGAIHAE